ncbi:peptide deformylase [Thermosulfidibacter takaii ABI70S6]|uniref:Peptide deformylase n=1 Tax=Thermosulfidibacter takaii (strain DSM 17441 / JCM 13301 / NBRC 103674 / ABI70S6) TaxID=1298851 RepID=A0A0S3QSE9_THET7|nr:peptide deformylase [Thermosulfidibacter takaii]BAT71217.1 peptide deformylase [Thermosulfidibacter takaii ABI70S6]
MAVRKIITYPDPILRQKCLEVQEFNGKINQVIQDLLDTMNHFSHSIGIAAPQIGEPYRIICVDVSRSPRYKKKHHGLIVLINPVVVCGEGEKTTREGCMSVPDFVGYVTRKRVVLVKGITPDEKEVEIEAKHLEAVALQHEIDHLNGVLFIDRVVSPSQLMKRDELIRK